MFDYLVLFAVLYFMNSSSSSSSAPSHRSAIMADTPFTHEVVYQMISDRTPLVVSSPDIDFSFSSYILGFDPKRQILKLKNTVPLDYIKNLAHKFTFTISIPMFQITTTTFRGDGINFIFPIDKIEKVKASRAFHRFKPTTSQSWFSYQNPYDGTTKYKKKILTISEGGLSFETTMQSALIHPNQHFTQGVVLINNKIVGQTSFTTVYMKQHFNMNSHEQFRVGVKFDSQLPQITQIFT